MTHERIPENPVENLKRMESILAGYRRKLAHKKKVRDTTKVKLARLRDAMVEDGESDTPEAKSRKVIERKYVFDLSQLDAVIEEFDGKIVWASVRQIPFIQSEVERVQMEAGMEAEATAEEV